MRETNDSIKGNVHSVPLRQAQARTFAWQTKINPATGAPYPKSFRLSKVDFEEILANPDVKYIRVYPAVEMVEVDGELTEQIGILVVGVDEHQVDIIHADADASGIYDVAFPCPNTCGVSPLYKES